MTWTKRLTSLASKKHILRSRIESYPGKRMEKDIPNKWAEEASLSFDQMNFWSNDKYLTK